MAQAVIYVVTLRRKKVKAPLVVDLERDRRDIERLSKMRKDFRPARPKAYLQMLLLADAGRGRRAIVGRWDRWL